MSTYHRPLPPVGYVSTRMLANHTAMSTDFFVAEIKAGELEAVRVGREFRISYSAAVRYLDAKGFEIPDHWVSQRAD